MFPFKKKKSAPAPYNKEEEEKLKLIKDQQQETLDLEYFETFINSQILVNNPVYKHSIGATSYIPNGVALRPNPPRSRCICKKSFIQEVYRNKGYYVDFKYVYETKAIYGREILYDWFLEIWFAKLVPKT